MIIEEDEDMLNKMLELVNSESNIQNALEELKIVESKERPKVRLTNSIFFKYRKYQKDKKRRIEENKKYLTEDYRNNMNALRIIRLEEKISKKIYELNIIKEKRLEEINELIKKLEEVKNEV